MLPFRTGEESLLLSFVNRHKLAKGISPVLQTRFRAIYSTSLEEISRHEKFKVRPGQHSRYRPDLW